ncbi:hypothetical protein [Elioraea sp.]|uniref:hypothetical protein n=1 Tax=Elioraea sp. TaxID=2185103 RepID=UPI0025BAA388|nr:hypothetical protein [Elioraea sp.]
MPRLIRSDIVAVQKPTADVEVPGWGGSVTIVALSAADLEEWRAVQAVDDKTPGLGVATLIALSVRDGDQPMFISADDMGFLRYQPPVVLKPLVDAILKLNGLDTASRDDVAGN